MNKISTDSAKELCRNNTLVNDFIGIGDIYLNTFCFDTNSTRTLCSLNLNNNIILGSLFLSCLLGVGLTVLMIAAVFYLRRHFSLATFYPNHVKLFSKADMYPMFGNVCNADHCTQRMLLLPALAFSL